MARGCICDNCHQAQAEVERWVQIADGGQRTESTSIFAFMEQTKPRVYDFCSWKCAAEFATLRALDPEQANNG